MAGPSSPADAPPNSLPDEQRPLLQRPESEPEPLVNDIPAERTFSSLSHIIKFTVLFTGSFLANVDTSFVIATYGSISSEFGQASIGPWVLIAYNLGYSVVLPMYGAFGDRYGSLPPLLVAYTLFMGGCAMSGSANELWQVIVGRALSGAGGAGMMAMVAFIITELAPPDKVAGLRSYINLFSILGRSSGGPIGGVVTDAIPIAATCWVCAAWLWTSSWIRTSHQEHPNEPSSGNTTKRSRNIDWPGIVTFTAALTSFLLAITLLDDSSHLAPRVYGYILIAITIVSMFAFLLVEAYYATSPLIPLSSIKGSLGVQMFIQFWLLYTQLSIVSNTASYFVRTEDASNLVAALHLLPVAVGNAIGALIAGRIIQITKRYKALGSIGLCSSTVGFGLMTFRWRGPISIFESLYLFFTGFGVGVVNGTQFVALTIGISKDRTASVVSLFLLSQQIGNMIGISGSAALLHGVFRQGLIQRLSDLPDGPKIIQNVLDRTRYAFELPSPIQKMVLSSYVNGFTAVCGLSTGMSVMLQIILASMKEKPIK